MNLVPCRICNGTRLQAKWHSEDGVGWVHCDTCGNRSTPLSLTVGRAKLIEQWNKEQETND